MSVLFKQRRFWFFVLTAATAIYLFVIPGWYFIKPFGNDSKGGELLIYGQIPDFQLTERSGKTIERSDLNGKIWIADFIFTRCAGICPMMSSRMKALQEKFKHHPEVQLVSFSVDPKHDTPEILSGYAKRFEADPEKWLFLTGEKEQIHRLSQQHFHLGVSDVPESEREAPEQTVDHSSKFVVVDRQGRIRGYYASEELNFLDAIARDIARIQKE